MDIQISEGLGPLGHLTYYATNFDGDVVGYLQFADQRPGLDGRLIGHIEVAPSERRKGIATRLWHFAKAAGINPVHALDKTPEGQAWAQAVGD